MPYIYLIVPTISESYKASLQAAAKHAVLKKIEANQRTLNYNFYGHGLMELVTTSEQAIARVTQAGTFERYNYNYNTAKRITSLVGNWTAVLQLLEVQPRAETQLTELTKLLERIKIDIRGQLPASALTLNEQGDWIGQETLIELQNHVELQSIRFINSNAPEQLETYFYDTKAGLNLLALNEIELTQQLTALQRFISANRWSSQATPPASLTRLLGILNDKSLPAVTLLPRIQQVAGEEASRFWRKNVNIYNFLLMLSQGHCLALDAPAQTQDTEKAQYIATLHALNQGLYSNGLLSQVPAEVLIEHVCPYLHAQGKETARMLFSVSPYQHYLQALRKEIITKDWQLGFGGDTICHQGKDYKVPAGVKPMVEAIQRAEQTDSWRQTFKEVKQLAKTRVSSYQGPGFFAKRSLETQWFYEDIAKEIHAEQPETITPSAGL